MTTTQSAPKPKVDSEVNAGIVWLDGELVPADQATTSVLSHALHYGSSVFEGIRCYETPKGPAVFRLPEHVERLFHSAHILRMEVPFPAEQITAAIHETIKKNERKSCYVRPLVWRSGRSLGVNPMLAGCSVLVATWEWGRYLGDANTGIRLVSLAWGRPSGNAMPTKSKAGGNYVVPGLAKSEAIAAGADEALLYDGQGYVVEGTGENLFFIRKGVLHPIMPSTGLLGITRESVMTMAADMGVPVEPAMATRDELYIADEVFLTGTAAEITPVAEIDRRKVKDGKVGPITKRLMDKFDAITHGRDKQYEHWLSYVK
jgi:branched-chain amino acid aminotransferase